MSEAQDVDLALLKRFPLPRHADDAGKEDRGRLLVVAGSRQLPGAALLAGTAGLRAGCGKLQIATAESIAVQIGIAIPEARVIPHRETEQGCIDESEIEPLLKWSKSAQAVLLGCGLQEGPSLETLIDALLASGIDIPLVLDAAVLGSLPARADALKAWKGGSVVLPHAGEMARMLDRPREEVEADPLAAARTAADRLGVVAVVKGEYSVIVSPEGEAFSCRGGGVGLATSGSGDTIAGIVGGLTARGADPLTAALWGVHIHAEAGRRLTVKVGRVGFLARELLDPIPMILEGRT